MAVLGVIEADSFCLVFDLLWRLNEMNYIHFSTSLL